ncbi:hypothetical protein BLNAU_19780 [Blattamonas nauphoetae]|uniref:Uncharacterized protein n=1 Tax=Blattamonas nauphoetae TaxID=2049346 RepID=A0ABQ9X1Q7_9EUKA|nr:hypothetical protein BLNAU_19780 [Blattamonas nauphoetae]
MFGKAHNFLRTDFQKKSENDAALSYHPSLSHSSSPTYRVPITYRGKTCRVLQLFQKEDQTLLSVFDTLSEMKVKVTRRRTGTPSKLTGEQSRAHPISSPEWTLSNISPLLKVLQCDEEDIVVETLRVLQKMASECGSGDTRISLCPNVKIADYSLESLYRIVVRDPPALTLLPSPIFPSSSRNQQYSGLSFLTALTKKLRIVFSEFRTNLQIDPSNFSKYTQLTNDNQFNVTHSLNVCSFSTHLPFLLLKANPPIEVDSAVIRELILFVKEALRTILTHVENIDTLIASLPSDSSSTTPLVSGVTIQTIDSLKQLRNDCEDFLNTGWCFFINVTNKMTDPHKSSFKTIVLDDPSFPDLILNSLKLSHKDFRTTTVITVNNTLIQFPWMKERFMIVNLVERMLETVDFDSLDLLKFETLDPLTTFIDYMSTPIGDDEEAHFDQYPLIRVSVFEPAKQFITFIFKNSHKLDLAKEDKLRLGTRLCMHHLFITNMELRSDEHDAAFVSELVKWETRQMVEMENEKHFQVFFESMLTRTSEWNQEERERQKRRQSLLREEGWDDAFELRVVGIEVDTNQDLIDFAEDFRNELRFNWDLLWSRF